MSTTLAFATSAITLALVLYTIGVMWERNSESGLRPVHLLFFIGGLTFDAIGTSLMGAIAQTSDAVASTHLITGSLALALMLGHALWATIVLIRNNPESKQRFHKLSTAVWLFWLVPYAGGMFMGVPALHFGDAQSLLAATAVAGVVGMLLMRKSLRA
ncbi:HsmA family protein [Curtanaerobium respiraculi]|uniref:HsmA family protein n=1 Tax=Curtanaerobium respiraculi TaxID=2949669 RepID=UPI0024B37E97|nr:HsmA family protein [Curtanaerobium respiraculi]